MSLRIRPKLQYVIPIELTEAVGRVQHAVGLESLPCRVDLFRGHAVLHVNKEEEHVWSPFLSVDLVWHSEGTQVRGLFGPKPSIWSLFIAGYAICLFLVVFAGSFGFAQWTLGHPPWAFHIVWMSVLASVAIYMLARYGQKKGAGQMDLLQNTLREILAE